MNSKFWVKKLAGFIAFAIILTFLLGYTVMILWNSILTEVLRIPAISFWQAFGILVLSKILFGGFQGGCGGHRGSSWKKELQEKWHGMSAEEREKMKEEWRNRCRVWKKSE